MMVPTKGTARGSFHRSCAQYDTSEPHVANESKQYPGETFSVFEHYSVRCNGAMTLLLRTMTNAGNTGALLMMNVQTQDYTET